MKTPSNTNLVASWHIKREKGYLPVDVRRSKRSLPKVPTASHSSAEASLCREEAGERKIKKRAVDDKNAKDRTTGRAPAFFLL